MGAPMDAQGEQDKAAFLKAGMERVREAIADRVRHDVASFEDIERAVEAALSHLIGVGGHSADAAPAVSGDDAPPSSVPEAAGAAAPASPAPAAPAEGGGG